MIKLVLILLSIILSYGNAKPKMPVSKKDFSITSSNKLPTCIKNKIDSFKLKELYEKPQRVIEYVYKEKKVYYFVMPCCDFFNEVYDESCNYLGAPDGGFTGKGDGKLSDFFKEAAKEKLIWGSPK